MSAIDWNQIEQAAIENPTPEHAVRILYTNWKGETGYRRIQPLRVVFESSEWHLEPQWIIRAVDLDKKAIRSFALRGISYWGPDVASGEILYEARPFPEGGWKGRSGAEEQ